MKLKSEGEFSTGAHSIAKLLRTPLAERVAEIAILDLELTSALKALQLIRDRFPPGEISEDDGAIQMALFRDSIMLFTGCFDPKRKGERLEIAETFTSIENANEFVKWAKAIRDKYVAHSVGPGRQAVSLALVHPQTCQIIGAGPFHMDWAGISTETVSELGKAVSVALRHIKARAHQLNDELLAETMAMTSEEVARLPDAQLQVPGSAEMEMLRHRFRDLKVAEKPKHDQAPWAFRK